jgi:hypothetical protein
VDAFVKAYPNLPGYHMWSTWDRLTAVSTYEPPGSEEDDEPDYGWDFSGLDNPSAMRDFMTACDYCLSDCSDGSHRLDDEDCGPSRECFHVDLGGLDEGNHLGMPEDGDPPRPAPRVDILRELAVVLVPAGGQDAQLEQIREMQARLDEEAGQLMQLGQNIGQEWAGRAPAGEACHLPQDVQHRVADDARARLPPVSSGVGQNLATAAILLRVMPEPSTTEGRRIQGELKNLLEDAAVRRAKSSASRRQGYPPENRVATSRFMWEASIHTERTRDKVPAAPGRLGNEHHRRDLVSKLVRKTPTRASELMDIATKFASGQEAVEAIFRKDKQPQGRQPEDVPEASAQRGTKNKGKKKSQTKHDAADADLVAAAEHRNPRKPPGGANLFDKMLKESCPYH